MKYFLVNFDKDWADEFNAKGAFVANEKQINALEKILGSDLGEAYFTYSFGTNEGWEDAEESIREVWENDFSQTKITREEALVLDKFRSAIAGICPSIGSLVNMTQEEADDEGQELIDEYNAMKNNGDFHII